MFFCTVACTLILDSDKIDKAAETPVVTYYSSVLTADITLTLQGVGEVGLSPSNIFFFLPMRTQE
jgi:hypothetical protein